MLPSKAQDDGAPSESSGWLAASCAARRSCTGSAGSHAAVFRTSCQRRDCWSGSEHRWLWATAGESAKKSRRSFTVNASIDQAAIGLAAATVLGASIGFERQWRQRMAGLRTKTLVAIGAASFVIFESLFPDDGGPPGGAAAGVS